MLSTDGPYSERTRFPQVWRGRVARKRAKRLRSEIAQNRKIRATTQKLFKTAGVQGIATNLAAEMLKNKSIVRTLSRPAQAKAQRRRARGVTVRLCPSGLRVSYFVNGGVLWARIPHWGGEGGGRLHAKILASYYSSLL